MELNGDRFEERDHQGRHSKRQEVGEKSGEQKSHKQRKGGEKDVQVGLREELSTRQVRPPWERETLTLLACDIIPKAL